MTAERRTRNTPVVLMAAGLGLLAAALLWSYLRPGLWLLDLVVVPAVWLALAAGLALLLAGAVMRGRHSARAAAGPAALVVGAVALCVLIGPWWQITPKSWFVTHRGLYELALRTDPGTSYYGTSLPAHLRFLTAGGTVSGNPQGARFFPQWIGVPDDAGGYWYSPGRSPAGYDMYGMVCDAPVSLGDDWWMCGI
ncbi:hypothetical protein [Gordonia sp. FQ]|uniref:hypothetical protein n=1 Tax=Gordonia sp. FQ TaxID=3446634 RepID=UPI003F8249AC